MASTGPATTVAQKSADGRTVLLVEDDRDVTQACGLRLRALGFDVMTAADGAQGVALATAARPDAIIMDVRMPKTDGLAALSQLKARDATSRIPIIMLSASISAEDAALRQGARFFLRKPYRAATLVSAVETAISEQAKTRPLHEPVRE